MSPMMAGALHLCHPTLLQLQPFALEQRKQGEATLAQRQAQAAQAVEVLQHSSSELHRRLLQAQVQKKWV